MIAFLQISNLALMERVSLELESGFTAVTGETGAGKSVLLGALSLLAGARADKSLIRQGADECTVEASLAPPEVAALEARLAELELPPLEDGNLLLKRSLHRKKGGRVLVNGGLATLTALQELAGLWIDFHGPDTPRTLYRDRRQLELVDLFAHHPEALGTYATGYRVWRETLREMDELRTAERLDPDELEFYQKQIAQIETAGTDEFSIAQLEIDFARLQNARELMSLADKLRQGLIGRSGVTEQVGQLLRHARELATLDQSSDPLRERLEALSLEASDLAEEFSAIGEGADFDDGAANELNERMQAWLSVKRKYGPTLEAVREKKAELSRKVGGQGDIEGRLLRLEKDAAKQEQALAEQANALRAAREKAAVELAGKVRKLLERLGFKEPRFRIDLTPTKLHETGDCAVLFLFSPNAGVEPMPLSKIASSGEAARVMLALKTVLAEVDHTPVLVFDEVDANVGGEIGAEVGRELAALAGQHQVFCITHLPQVAAQAQRHYVVRKTQEAGETSIDISPLHQDAAAREEELARMLGSRSSKSAREHARSLLAG